MTMPSLIAKHKEKVLKKQFAVAYSLINQAAQSSINKFGTTPGCYYYRNNYYDEDGKLISQGKFGECSTFYNNLLSELKVIKTCENTGSNNCAPTYKGREQVEEANWDADEDEKIDFLNGACPAVLSARVNNGKYHILANSIILKTLDSHLLVDVNGMKGPNKWGHDVFMFAPRAHSSNNSGNIILGEFNTTCVFAEKGGYLTSEMIKNMHK